MLLVAWLVGGLLLVAAFFVFLQWRSDKTYRPSISDIKDIIVASIEGRLDLMAFDEFSCVRIAYDTRLDQIRERYNAIVEERAHIEGEFTKMNSTPLNAAGKAKLQELIRELESLQPNTYEAPARQGQQKISDEGNSSSAEPAR